MPCTRIALMVAVTLLLCLRTGGVHAQPWRDVTAAALDVQGAGVVAKSRPHYALQEGTNRFAGFVFLGQGAPADLTANVLSTSRRARLNRVRDSWDLVFDSRGLAAGAVVRLDVEVSSRAQGRRARWSTTLEVLRTETITAALPPTGAQVKLGRVTLNFAGNGRADAVLIRHAPLPSSGSELVQVDISGQPPRAPLHITADCSDESHLGKRAALRGARYASLLEELSATRPYSNKNSPDSLRWAWSSGCGIYLYNALWEGGWHHIAAPPDDYLFTVDPSWELNGLVQNRWPRSDWQGFRPVLFIHGYTLHEPFRYPYFGGGPETWGGFPNLVKSWTDGNGQHYVPFEFRWNTDTSFELQAVDLANAIRWMRHATGQHVTVVAHSFGGLLTRALLQLLPGEAYRDARDAAGLVLTLGTPHSGISDTARILHGVALPAGQDGTLFEGCDQISCHVAGEWTLSPWETSLLGLSDLEGEEVAALFISRGMLPNINFAQGFGNTQVKSGDAFVYGTGDDLISHNGQRLLPDKVNLPMQDWEKLLPTGAVVKEQLLGLKDGISITPGAPAPKQERFPDDRWAQRYCHAPLPCKTSGKGGTGFEANIPLDAEFGCDTPATCQHGGWRLFKELVSHVVPPPDPPGPPGWRLNDTGWGADFCLPEDGGWYFVACDDPRALPGQDAHYGRDADSKTNRDRDGALGFAFAKVCNSGEYAGKGTCPVDPPLGPGLNEWGCTYDKVTGLDWEIKTTDGGLRDWRKYYTNYSPDFDPRGEYGGPGDATGLVNAVNATGLCGQVDWHLPRIDELQSIVDYSAPWSDLLIDVRWFPNTAGPIFWSSTPYLPYPDNAWVLWLDRGHEDRNFRANSFGVRLVRGGR